MLAIYTCQESEKAGSKDNDVNKARKKEDCWELNVGQSLKISRLSWIRKSKSLLALPKTEKSPYNVV